MHARYVALAGSEREVMPGAGRLGPADPAERIRVTVVLRPPEPVEETAPSPASGPLRPPVAMTRTELATARAARPDDIESVRAFARSCHLGVDRVRSAERSLVLTGTVAAFARAFRVELERYELAGRIYRGRTGPIQLPETLAGTVVAVLGLDDRPAAEPR